MIHLSGPSKLPCISDVLATDQKHVVSRMFNSGPAHCSHRESDLDSAGITVKFGLVRMNFVEELRCQILSPGWRSPETWSHAPWGQGGHCSCCWPHGGDVGLFRGVRSPAGWGPGAICSHQAAAASRSPFRAVQCSRCLSRSEHPRRPPAQSLWSVLQPFSAPHPYPSLQAGPAGTQALGPEDDTFPGKPQKMALGLRRIERGTAGRGGCYLRKEASRCETLHNWLRRQLCKVTCNT